MKDDRLYLIHIQECIVKIDEYIRDGKNAFMNSVKTQDAVLRNLHTLSESTQRLSAALKTKYGAVDWKAISGFRNVLVHDYLGVDLDRIWDIVEQDLPSLQKAVQEMLDSL